MVNGHSVDFCAKKIGHDLVEAMGLAQGCGLKLSDLQQAVIATLAVEHRRKPGKRSRLRT
jgi:hypothetical protein